MIMTAVVIAAAGLAVLVFRLLAARDDRVRLAARRLYANAALVLPARAAVVNAPFLGGGCLVMSVALTLPRPLGLWLALPALTLFAAAFVVSYRPSSVLMPRWMREEIAAGRLRQAKPDLFDWAFAVVAGLPLLVSPLAGIVLIVVFGAGNG